MLNRNILVEFSIIILVVLAQVFIFNNIEIHSVYNPFFFLVWIIFMPVNYSYTNKLFSCFALGLLLDFFSGTLGLNALSCIVVFQLRYWFLNRVFSNTISEEMQLNQLSGIQLILYILFITLFYNVFYYCLESFNFQNFTYSLVQGLINGFYSFLTIIIFYGIFKKRLLE